MSTTAIILTIIGWIITIGIAILTVCLNNKDTNKKIACLEKSTAKQVESVKDLAKIIIETSQIQINKELWEARTKHLQASQKKDEMTGFGAPFCSVGEIGTVFNQRMSEERNLSYESDYQQKYVQVLELYQGRLMELSKKMGGE